MIRHSLAVLFIVLAAASAAAQSSEDKIREGIGLFDAGKYDEAMARFKAVLAEEPGNAVAAYELALTYTAKREFAQCRSTLEKIVDKADSQLRPAIYMALGNCLDEFGERPKAIALYRQGLQEMPGEPMLQYNLAISLIRDGEAKEARELIKSELRVQPGHASGHYVLAKLFEGGGYRIPAMLEYFRFLAIELNSARTKEAATRLRALLDAGVEAKGKNITINVNPSGPKDEGDFSTAEMMLALAAGAKNLPENRRKSEFERLQDHAVTSITMLLEAPRSGDDYTATVNLPFFRKLSDQNLLNAFMALTFRSLELKGWEQWTKKHQKEMDQLLRFMVQHLEGGGTIPTPTNQ